ncbi:MAG: hypothetical protein KC427_05295 [Sulfurovum sp.]|uniref:hypothetical protein n=1 Tax=Sulfurovum sp. TaxID=1969726 RepID=UPI002867E4FF|nr:hypothetical protein [Sulfurovum sp.]MCO4845418.1 hypothetical protein [Sulfurovum sp.]
MRKHINKKNVVRVGLLGVGLTMASMFYVTGCGGGGGGGGGGIDPSLSLCSTPIEASLTDGLDGQTRIGGATTSVELLNVADANWTLYNTANELHATNIDDSSAAAGVILVDGYIHDIEIVTHMDNTYALLAMGEEGIVTVNVTDPLNMSKGNRVMVSYSQGNIGWTDGGGNTTFDNNISSSRAPISSLAVYNEGNETVQSWQVIIGDEGYGLHKTSLNNLIEENVDVNGTLVIDGPEKYTLQYAGENPWGGPKSLTLVGEGNDTKIFVAQGFMGMGIYNTNLDQVGRYNLYTDATEANNGEDWFYDMDISAIASTDSCTGMPDYNQAKTEIDDYIKDTGTKSIPTPWADFEFKGGKYYYDARKIDVATVTGDTNKTIAYIAYGLAGMVAVDVTEVTPTVPAAGCEPIYEGTYLGYVPAMPIKGPESRLIGNQDQNTTLYTRAGSGMLKDAGVVDVKVDAKADPTKVFYTDHFGGLMVINHAEDPVIYWKGDAAPYPNDTNETEHIPSYDFVTSYDMTPSSSDEEALPTFTTEAPILLTTGEVGGHGNSLALTGSSFDESNDLPADVVMAAGAGGLNFIEVYGTAPTYYAFNVTAQFATTDELGADEYGDATVPLNVGHAAGVGTYDNLLYLADGPHGVSVWEVASKSCVNIPTDQVGLVGNTIQAEGSVEVNGTMIYPTPHADEVVVINDDGNKSALVASLSTGLRRVNVNTMGTVGTPALLYPTSGDIFQHSVEEIKVAGINLEDRVYSIAVAGDYAFTADGLSGVTVYDLSKDPTDTTNASGYIVDNSKVGTNATDIALWYDASSGKSYAFVAVGAKGISVLEVNRNDGTIVKEIGTFEPYKVNPGDVVEGSPSSPNTADGVSIALKVVGNYVYFTYDSFGVVAYSTDKLIQSDITTNRPEADGYFKLQNESTYTNNVGTDFAEWSGGASGIDAVSVGGNDYIYVAYGSAGVIKIDWSDVANPVLMEHANTAGDANDVVVWNGRVYVADGAGGLVLLK